MNSQYRYDWTVLLQIFVLIELNGYRGKEAVKGNVSITVTNRGEIQSSTVYVKNYFPFATTFTLCLDCKTVRIFAYSVHASSQTKGLERGWKQRARLEERRGCEARALRARKTLTPHFTDFVTDFEKKNHCFAVYLMSCSKSNTTFLVSLLLCSIKGKQLYEHL